jgi:hypothetical protein
VPQFRRYDSGLQRIEAEITAYNLVMVFWFRAVSAKALQFFSSSCVVGDYHSAVTGCAKVLGREEGKASVVPDRAGAPALVLCANGLRGVFNDHQTEFPSDGHHSIHLCHFAVRMNWNDGAGLTSHFRCDLESRL